MPDVFRDTAEFNHRIIGLPLPAAPERLSPARKAWALCALREEAQELEDAETLEDEVDALMDLIYFAGGRLREMGVVGRVADGCWDAIHSANMRKRRGELSKRPNSLGFDAVKPEGWQAPDLAPIIASSRRPRILVLGSARHGKDTVAEMLRDLYGLRFSSSSMFCAERVLMPYFRYHGVPYATAEECYADRVNHRATWFQQIEAYNDPDRSRLAREMLEAGNDMYVGMRSAKEFAEARGLFDHVVWVDAFGRGLPQEDPSSFDIPYDNLTMHVIDNGGTLEDLEHEVRAFAREIGLEASA